LSQTIRLVEEKIYPIYSVSARWAMDDSVRDPTDAPHWHEGLTEGRIWNSTGYSTMLQAPDLERVQREAREWWELYKNKGGNPSDLALAVAFVRNEAWCSGWFSHWTFDTGQSDEEVLASFERFVRRMEDLNRSEGKYVDGYWCDAYCLMCAADRYRWCASPSGGSVVGFHAEHKPAPCRCECCRKRGIVRIDH
jgi:hypothetical protein